MGAAVGRNDAAGAAPGPPGLAVTSAYGRLVGGAQQSPTNVWVADGLAAGRADGEAATPPGVATAAAQAETTRAAAMTAPQTANTRGLLAGPLDCSDIAAPLSLAPQLGHQQSIASMSRRVSQLPDSHALLAATRNTVALGAPRVDRTAAR